MNVRESLLTHWVYISTMHIQVTEPSCLIPRSRRSSCTGAARLYLPLAFRLHGDRVRVRRVESGILLEPMVTDIDAWFAELDRFADVPFMEDGRRQPPVPEPEDPFA